MPLPRKLTVYRRSQFKGPRRGKPRVRALNAAIRAGIVGEQGLLNRLVQDADVRRYVLGRAVMADPIAVWTDFDHEHFDVMQVNVRDLPRWEKIGEYLKLHLLFQAALTVGGYSFTVRVRPDLEAKWTKEGRDSMDRIRRLVRKALEDQGLEQLAFAYVVETRTRSGGSRTGMHLHGFFLTDNPHIATRFAIGVDRTLAAHPRGRAAAGIRARSGKAIQVAPSYDVIDDSEHGRGRWASYITKNITRWDDRFGRRIYISLTAKQTVRAFWALLREEH